MTQTATTGIENRRYPGYPAALDVTLRGLPFSKTNVSERVQLICPSMNFRLVAEDLKTAPLTICSRLPGGNVVHAQAEAVYVSPDDDEDLIGVKLSSFAVSGQALFERYVETLRERHG